MAIAVVILLLVLVSVIFHFASPWWFTPIASNWTAIDDTISITFWITGIVFILVNAFLAFCVFRFRFKKNHRADYEPENKKLEVWLTVITTIGVAAMLAPGLVVWGQFVTVPENAKIFEVVGQQWHWSYRLPGKDGVLGQSAVELISETNPFGLNPDDLNAHDDILIPSNVMHIVIDQPVKVMLRSKDVLHNFAVPQFRVKMDLVPGIETFLWFTPTRLGRFEMLCEELCGMAHYTMRGQIVVDTAQDYQAWLDKQFTFRESLDAPAGDLQLGQSLYASCAVCHGNNAQGNETLNAPMLAGQSAWYLTRQLHYYQNKIRGSNQQDTYGQQMSAMANTLVDAKAIKDVTAYIASLPALAIFPASVNNDSLARSIESGQRLFTNCAYCHGDNAEGRFALNAPRLAGQHAWYLKRQLQHYRASIRGSHREDIYGSQMLLMSRLLQNEQAIDDVIAYISRLTPSLAKQTKKVQPEKVLGLDHKQQEVSQ
ncbi:c-type cytochrome [Shewanella eurypsychrophilus]|uniref:cytochrome-c oxidase n=1 Tax=Shewanella eurypsychrophilus TaxID=2593656 RepID=A0ABX6VEK0_9GAMM|nr:MULTISPECIES: c-type cytochrome [Shewanella]QFU25082.1 c-type cytochrome [Shewanella sp. YLB-09]QPG60254.1 c-type cytochrome [Shewanella eurypsychrophilus]